MWDWHLEESERNVMQWVPVCTGAYLRRRWRDDAGIEEADLYFEGEEYNEKVVLFFFVKIHQAIL